MASTNAGPMFPCNKSHEPIVEIEFLATVGSKRGGQPFSSPCSLKCDEGRKEICSTCLFQESIPAIVCMLQGHSTHEDIRESVRVNY